MTKFQPATIDPTLLDPVPVPELQGDTLADMADLIVDYDEALDRANGQISAIAETIAAQEVAND